MELEIKQDRSVYYFVKTHFASTPYITVEDGFPNKILTLPTVSVELDYIDFPKYELGNRSGLILPVWYIDIFAKDKNQRDEYAFALTHALENGVPVYDYGLGYPPTVVPQIGILQPDEIRIKIIRVMPELVETLYFRSSIQFMASYSPC